MKNDSKFAGKGKPKDADATVALPNSIEAERRLLGAILKNNDVYDEIASLVQADDFFESTHKSIFEAIARELTSKNGMKATPVLIAGRYFSSGDGVNASIASEMEKMVALACFGGLPGDNAKLIADLAARRHAYELCTTAAADALNLKSETYADDLMSGLEKRGAAGFEVKVMAELGDELLSDMERMSVGEIIDEAGFRTGFLTLDRLMSPICPGNYVTLAAPTGQGKTSFGLQLAYNLAKSGAPVAYFTLEMPAKQLAKAMIAMIAGLDKRYLRPGEVSGDDLRKWRLATEEFKDLRIQILDQQPLTPDAIFSRTRTLVRKQGIEAVFVDYFGKLQMPGRFGSTQEEANRKSDRLQKTAGTLGLPMIILHQLNREVYKRPDKTPILTDLRDTGAIENDSDLVMFIQRGDFALQMNEPDVNEDEKHQEWKHRMEAAAGKSTVWLAKDRQTGAKGRVEFRYNGIGQYTDIAATPRGPNDGPLQTGFDARRAGRLVRATA